MQETTGSIYLAACGGKHLRLVTRVPFVCLSMCSCDGLCGPSPDVENQSNVLFKPIKTIQTYQIHQLGVDLRRNMALPREAFKKNE